MRFAGKEQDIQFNCNGLTFNTQHVRLANGSSVTCSIIDRESVKVLLNEQYQARTAADAKADLAAGKKVVGIYLNAANPRQPVHSIIMTKLVLNADGSVNYQQSECALKNGWSPLIPSSNTGAIGQLYATIPALAADRADILVYFTLR